MRRGCIATASSMTTFRISGELPPSRANLQIIPKAALFLSTCLQYVTVWRWDILLPLSLGINAPFVLSLTSLSFLFSSLPRCYPVACRRKTCAVNAVETLMDSNKKVVLFDRLVAVDCSFSPPPVSRLSSGTGPWSPWLDISCCTCSLSPWECSAESSKSSA